MMGLLTPWFLAGLAALGLPLLVHLVRRQLEQSEAFPSLMFLRDIEYKERRRRTLRDPLLLLLRCALLALLALAFARPFWVESAAVAGAGRDRLVLLDRSYSMAYGGRWEAALAATRAAVEELGAQDRAALLLFDQTVELGAEFGHDRKTFATALGAYASRGPGFAATDFSQALAQAAELLSAVAESAPTGTRMEIVMVSDFQRGGRDPDDDYRLPAAVTLIPVSVATESEAGNTALVGVDSDAGGRDGRLLEARVRRSGGSAGEVGLSLELGGRDPQTFTRRLLLPGDGLGSVDFTLPAPAAETTTATLRLDDDSDALSADNVFYTVLSVPPTIDVLVLHGAGARDRHSLYLQRALALSERPRFEVRVKALAELSLDDFDTAAVLAINDAPLPGGELDERLRRFLAAGGGLLVAAGDGVQGGWPDYLPGQLGSRQQPAAAAIINRLQLGHPALAALAGAGQAALSDASVLRYRQLRPTPADRVLAYYDTTDAALLERPIGAGRALALGTTLDTYWNDLALTPVFVPLVHGLFAYLGGYQPTPPAALVGEVLDLAAYARAHPGGAPIAAALNAGSAALLETPSGGSAEFAAELYRPQTPGFYWLRRGDRQLPIAVNVNPVEADLGALDPQAFAAGISAATAGTAAPAGARTQTARQTERQSGWWQALLSGVLLLLLFETVWSNRPPSRERAHG